MKNCCNLRAPKLGTPRYGSSPHSAEISQNRFPEKANPQSTNGQACRSVLDYLRPRCYYQSRAVTYNASSCLCVFCRAVMPALLKRRSISVAETLKTLEVQVCPAANVSSPGYF